MGREAEAERGGGGCGAVEVLGGSGREEETIIVPGSDSSERVIEFTGSHRSGRLVGIVYFNGESLFRQISAS